MSLHRVGGEVDGYCTKCKLLLAHTILAMDGTKIARVRCNTCYGDHIHRPDPALAAARVSRQPSRAAASKEKPEKVVMSVNDILSKRDLSTARPYKVSESYAVDDVISHPTFGFGIVSAIRGDKMDVSFKATEKTLIQGRLAKAPAL